MKTRLQNRKFVSLQESYTLRKRIAEVRLSQESRLLSEATRTGELLLEELSKGELKQATEVVKKLGALEKVVPDDSEEFKAAISDAMEDVRSFMGGGGLKQMLSRGIGAVASKLGIKVGENPLLKSLTLMSSLEKSIPELKDTVEKTAKEKVFTDENKEKPLSDAIGDEVITKNLMDIVAKSMAPEGVFSKLSSLFGKGIPYVKDVKKFVRELFATKVGEIDEIVKVLESGIQAEDVEDTTKELAKDNQEATGGGSSGGKGGGMPSQGAPVVSPAQLALVVAAGSATEQGKDPSDATQAAKKDPKAMTNKFIDFLAKKSGKNPENVKAVLTAMLKSKLLIANVELKESFRRGATATLTGFDVLRAVRCLNESRGSTSRWVELLFEDANEVRQKRERYLGSIEKDLKDAKSFDELIKVIKEKNDKNVELGDLIEKLEEFAKTPGMEKDTTFKNENFPAFLHSIIEDIKNGDSPSPSGGEKLDKIVDKLKADLKNIEPQEIKAILEAIPDFLFPDEEKK
jgi:hypothetical protein